MFTGTPFGANTDPFSSNLIGWLFIDILISQSNCTPLLFTTSHRAKAFIIKTADDEQARKGSVRFSIFSK